MEPYKLTAAANKITLVSAGYVAPDIAKLGIRTVCWPDVFGKITKDLPQAERAKRTAREVATRSWNQKLGLVGIVDEEAAQRVVSMLERQNVWLHPRARRLGLDSRWRHSEEADHANALDMRDLIEGVD